ncbi:MAG: class E sortase [Acidimicrobiales bacterium]
MGTSRRARSARALWMAVVAVLVANGAVLGSDLVAVEPPTKSVVVASGPEFTFAADSSSQLPAFATLPEPSPPPLPQETAPVAPPADEYAAEPAVVIGTIEIPRLGLSVPLNEGISLRTIDRGPSHWPGSAMPGNPGNVVIAGHRVTKTRPFRHIDTLVPGDEIIFTVNGVRTVYAVNGEEIVTPDAMRIVAPTPTPTATLFACHPPGSARYRYVVTADLVSTGTAPGAPAEVVAAGS